MDDISSLKAVLMETNQVSDTFKIKQTHVIETD